MPAKDCSQEGIKGEVESVSEASDEGKPSVGSETEESEGQEVAYRDFLKVTKDGDGERKWHRRNRRLVGLCCLFLGLSAGISIIVLGATGAVTDPVSSGENGPKKGDFGTNTTAASPSNETSHETNAPVHPTTQPTPSPVMQATGTTPAPSPSPTTPPTSIAPTTSTPTLSPLHLNLLAIAGDSLYDESSPQNAAYRWMTVQDNREPSDVLQRFSALTVVFGLTGETSVSLSNTPTYLIDDECNWPIAQCDGKGLITHLLLPRQALSGTIPLEIGNLRELRHLDLAENSLVGSLPISIYELTNMTSLYLEHNQLTGTLSENVAFWKDLESISLGNNNFSGKIPSSLFRGVAGSLRYINLHHNRFSSVLPTQIALGALYYLDLSFNQLTGGLPLYMNGTESLRYFYLDHNQLSGGIPNWPLPLLEELHLNDNQLSGGLPIGIENDYPDLLTLSIHNNNLTQVIDRAVCDMDLFFDGNLIDLGIDCSICDCTFLCTLCNNN